MNSQTPLKIDRFSAYSFENAFNAFKFISLHFFKMKGKPFYDQLIKTSDLYVFKPRFCICNFRKLLLELWEKRYYGHDKLICFLLRNCHWRKKYQIEVELHRKTLAGWFIHYLSLLLNERDFAKYDVLFPIFLVLRL